MANILTLTVNPAVDTTCSVARLESGTKLRCSKPVYSPGGGGINVARAIHQLGGSVHALWLGGGTFGQQLAELLDQEGLSHQMLPVAGQTRENLTLHEQETGQSFRLVLPGPEIGEADIQHCIGVLQEQDPDYLIMSGSLPPGADANVYARLSEAVPKTCRVVLDTSGEALARALDGTVYLIKPNLEELSELVDQELVCVSEIEQVSRQLIQEGRTQVVVTTLGVDGAILVSADQVARLKAPLVEFHSKLGAGDSSLAGICVGLARGEALIDAVRYGMAAGAAAVLRPGHQLCSSHDTQRLYEHIQPVHSLA